MPKKFLFGIIKLMPVSLIYMLEDIQVPIFSSLKGGGGTNDTFSTKIFGLELWSLG